VEGHVDPQMPISKISQKMLRNLNKSWQSWKVLIYIDKLDKNLDAANSGLKSLDFKNLNQEKKVDLNTMDILDGFQKLVSTVETPRLTYFSFLNVKCHFEQGW